ncbi:MAG: STAS/SEC14 domain-containing protein [Pseudomonadota bacterium]
MIELIPTTMDDVVAWRIDGKVSEDDMESALNAAKDCIDRCGHVNVYQEIAGFGGIEWDAIEEKMEFLREFGIKRFRRIAVVTDKQWMQTVIGWEDKIFRSIDMRAFSTEEKERAMNFLAYGDESGDEGAG